MPYILRPLPSPDCSHAFEVVGECYLSGIMNGKVLYHLRDELEAVRCMLPPTSEQKCSTRLVGITLR